MFRWFSILLFLLPLVSFGRLVTYANFEYGLCYRDDAGRYMAHGLGVYVTYEVSKIPSGWLHGFNGAETAITGTHDPQKLTPHLAVIYRGSFIVNYADDAPNNPSPNLDGSPYLGSPQSSSDGNLNDPARDHPPVGSLQLPPNISPPSNDDDLPALQDLLRDLYATYLEDENGDNVLSMVRFGEDGDNYVIYDEAGNVISSWPKSMGKYAPIRLSDGTVQWYNPDTGDITPNRPSDGQSSIVDLTPVISSVEGVQSRQDLQRQQLVDLLGAAGNSWVYDCSLSLADLQTLVSALRTGQITLNSNLSSIKSDVSNLKNNVGSINNSMLPIRTTLSTISSTESIINQNLVFSANQRHEDLSSIQSTLQSIDSKLPDGTETVPALPSPSLPTDSPDDNLPDYLQSFNWDVATPLSTVQGWASETGLIKFGLGSLDGWLARFLHVPSVGSDPHMFTVDFDIPYLGRIQRDFSFADWSMIPLFRQVALYALYVFFGLAIYKLLHKTLQ